MIAPFAPRGTLVLTADEVRTLDDDARDRLLDDAVTQGIGDVIIEIDDVAPELSTAVTARGLRLLIGVTCFHEHGEVAFGPDRALRPIDETGHPRRRLEWYVGLLPTDAVVVAELVARCARLAATPGVSGLVLDFIRWPLHWELELRADGPRQPASSFDRITLGDFSARTGCVVSADPSEAAAQIFTQHRNVWDRYRADTITRLVRLLADIAHARGIMLGAFVLPHGRAYVGQDIAAWEGVVDALYPMTYHAILHRPALWVGDVIGEIEEETSIPAVPIIQLTAAVEHSSGWDWGDEVDGAQLREAISAGGTRGPVGFFPGTALRLLPEAQTAETERAR